MKSDEELGEHLHAMHVDFHMVYCVFAILIGLYILAIDIMTGIDYLTMFFAGFIVKRIFLFGKAFLMPEIRKAPGTWLLALVDFFFSSKAIEQIFNPIIADWRYEYFEAFKQGRKWKARWISTRYRFSFIAAMCLSKVFSLLRQWKSVSK